MRRRDGEAADGPQAGDLPAEDEARRIYEEVMEQMNRACFDDDPALYDSVVHLPISISTYDTRMVMRTPDDRCRMMQSVQRLLREKNVTTYLRVCLGARFLDADTIEGVHESHVLNKMEYVQPRFPVRAILARVDGGWKIVSVEHALEDDAFLPVVMRRLLAHTIETRQPRRTGTDPDPTERTAE